MGKLTRPTSTHTHSRAILSALGTEQEENQKGDAMPPKIKQEVERTMEQGWEKLLLNISINGALYHYGKRDIRSHIHTV